MSTWRCYCSRYTYYQSFLSIMQRQKSLFFNSISLLYISYSYWLIKIRFELSLSILLCVYVYNDIPLLSGMDFLRLPVDERWRSAEPLPWSDEWERPHTEKTLRSENMVRTKPEHLKCLKAKPSWNIFNFYRPKGKCGHHTRKRALRTAGHSSVGLLWFII